MPLAFTTGTSSHPKNTLQKRKFKFKVLVLLHVLIPGVMLSSLETINPWLSACDLAQPVPPDLQGTCNATQHSPRTTPQRDGELSCPNKCERNHTKSDTENPQCLVYLDENQTESICSFKFRTKDVPWKTWLTSFMQEIRLHHCCEHKLIESLSEALLDKVYNGGEECTQVLNSLMDVDNLAARVSCEFNEVLSRFDCGQPYSVRFSCDDCKEAYRRWVCSSLLPFFNGTQRIRPCRSVCQSVEQKCPYFLPENRAPSLPTQYAGEPTFLCMDPNIHETGEQQKKSLYPEKGSCCVHSCGSPYKGLCIDKGIKCEDPLSNETVTNQSVECSSASDTIGSRVPSLACPAPVTYNSPHHLGSGSSLTKPEPLILALSTTCLIYPISNQIHYFILFILFNSYRLFYFRIINFIFCLNYTQIHLLFIRMRRKLIKFLFHLTIKFPKLIFNYFKFNSNKWQYYFILISVNLLFNLFNKNPEPFTTPSCLINGFIIINKKSEKTRRMRHFKRYYFPILSNIAQKLNEIILISRELRGLTKRKPFKLLSDYLVIETIKSHERCIRIKKQNSLTINRIKIYIIILKVLLIKDSHYRLKYKKNERQKKPFNDKKITESTYWSSKCFRYFKIRLINNSVQRTNVVDKSICMFLHSLRSYKYVWYYIIKSNINEKYSKKYYKRRLIPVLFNKKTNPHILIERRRRKIKKMKWREGGQEIKLKLVKSCQLMRLICSDPTCEFQTFLKKS